MEIDNQKAQEFAKLLIMRGFGLYGDQKMIKICEDSGIACRTDGSFEIGEKQETMKAIQKLIVNYSKFNLPAKMTTLVLAKKFDIPIPDELKSNKKKKSKYRMKMES